MSAIDPVLKSVEKKRRGKVGVLPKSICELLYKFIRDNNIKTIVETGVSYGFSTSYFLAALPKDGQLYSIEWDLMPESKLVIPKALRDRWQVDVGKSQDILVRIMGSISRPVDLFWHDSSHSFHNQYFEYCVATRYSRFVGSHDIYNRKRSAWDYMVKSGSIREIIKGDNFAIGDIND